MEQTNATNEAAKRPTFLTVLCILSFIAAGISIIVLLIGIAGKGMAESAGFSTDALGAGLDPALAAQMEQAKAALSWPNIIGGIVLSIVGLIGVIMMWKLKKKGFFIYAGAGVAGIILPLALGAGFSTFGTVITAGFIAMYFMNTKHMK